MRIGKLKPYAAEAELVLEVIKDIKENIDDIAFAANGGFVANASEERSNAPILRVWLAIRPTHMHQHLRRAPAGWPREKSCISNELDEGEPAQHHPC